MIEGKIPPQHPKIEAIVLGAILVDYFGCLPEVINLIFKEVFYVPEHVLIYEAVLNLYDKGKPVDILTVCEQLQKNEKLEEVGGHYFVTRLTNEVVSTANIETHCRLLLEAYLKRELIKITSSTMSEAFENGCDGFDLCDKTDTELINIQEKVLSGQIKGVSYYSNKVQDEYYSVKDTGVLGIKTPFTRWNKIMCGLVAPDLIIIASRPSMGKTALALSIVHDASVVNNVPCAFFSLEMDGTQLVRRLASLDCDLPHKVIRDGRLSTLEENVFMKSLDKVSKAPIFIEDKGGLNIRSLRTRANILKRKNGIKFIVVDYLQLMSGMNKGGNRESEISEISRSLKQLARELEIPVIALSQLSREVEKRPDKMPQLSDLRESGAIEQDADEVIFLMRPEFYDFSEPVQIAGKDYAPQGLTIIKTAKNRHGECENFALFFTGNTMKFKDHESDQFNHWTDVNKSFYETEKPF